MAPPRLPTTLDEVEQALEDANVAPLATEVGMSVAAGYASGLALRYVGRCVRHSPGSVPPSPARPFAQARRPCGAVSAPRRDAAMVRLAFVVSSMGHTPTHSSSNLPCLERQGDKPQFRPRAQRRTGEGGCSAAAVAVGGAFVFVQSLAYSGFVSVDWYVTSHSPSPLSCLPPHLRSVSCAQRPCER